MRLKNQNGFTLIEVLVVTIVIGIMAAIAAPNFLSWLPNIRLKGAARDLSANFQKAKIAAVKSQANVVVSLTDGVGGSYQVFVDNAPLPPLGTGIVDVLDPGEQVIANVVFPANITMTSAFSLGSTTPGFSSVGLPYNNRIGNVILQKSDNATLPAEKRRYYKINLSAAGSLKVEMSADGITWN